MLIDITDKFNHTNGKIGNINYIQGKIFLSSNNKEENDLIKANFIETIKILESQIENISSISLANKVNCPSEQKIHAELTDACILSQMENIPIITEDYLYLKMNELETKKEAPEYCSSLSLLKVLYEEGKLDFNTYLDFFGYLSTYRFRFLSLNSDDIEKAVFGDKRVKIICPKNIRKLNFSITLSEEYGVSFKDALIVVARFLLKVLLDNTLTKNIIKNIFIEIIETLPVEINKKDFGEVLLGTCLSAALIYKSNLILYPGNKLLYERVDTLLQLLSIYNTGINL